MIDVVIFIVLQPFSIAEWLRRYHVNSVKIFPKSVHIVSYKGLEWIAHSGESI